MFKSLAHNILKYNLYYKFPLRNSSSVNELCDLSNLDFNFLCDPSNTDEIKNNILKRKGVGDIDEVINLYKLWLYGSTNERELLKPKLVESVLKIPNMSHTQIGHLDNDPEIVKESGNLSPVTFKRKSFDQIANLLNVCRTTNMSKFTGPRSYYLLDQLSLLEQALIKYSLSMLKSLKFSLISVPDILPMNIIELCGMSSGNRNQIYYLDKSKYDNLCLSGTAEMGIAYYLHKKKLDYEKLPLKIAAVSRCFRAELSGLSEDKGIYRVHQFTKVEMFGVSSPEKSDTLLTEFVEIQEILFSSLGLQLRILDMPPHELGAQAARKYDVEAWLPGKERWGEVSSASNCTDYQSRRLGLTLKDSSYPHTINGTACAIPRLLIALLETYQKKDGSVELPQVLEPFLGFRTISKSQIPKLHLFKTRDRFK